MHTRQFDIAGAAAVLALLLSPQLASAAGFQNTSQSATATAMASVGTANPDEPNSTFYNPANMPYFEGFSVYLGLTPILPSSSWQSPDGQQTVNTDSSIFLPPNLHLSYSFGNLAFGLGVTFPYGLGITWPDAWAGREIIISQNLQTLNVNPAVAYKLDGIDLSFALGAQIVGAQLVLERDTVLRPGTNPTAVRAEIGGGTIGLGATAAIQYKPIPELMLALNYRSRVNLAATGLARFDGEEGTPFDTTFIDGDIEAGLTLPDSVTFGISYKLSKLTLMTDIVFTAWSTYDVIDLEFQAQCPDGAAGCEAGGTTPPDTQIVSNWNDSVALRFGAQYEVIDKLNLRLGAAYDMTPIPDETVSPSLPGNNRAVVSGGLGYTIAGFRGDLAYQYVQALEREVDNDLLDGTYGTTAHVIGISLGYGY